MRVVSLLPAATEIVAYLGERESLVGVSHECDWPPGIDEECPQVTDSQIDSVASSAQIDAEIDDILQRGLSPYEIDVERLRALEPDVVLTQDQCSVCAVDRAEVESALEDAVESEVDIVSLSPSTLGGVLENVTEVAEAIGCEAEGVIRRRKLAQKFDRATSGVPLRNERSETPEVCFIEWIDPLMVAGHWIPELVERAGGRYRWAEAGARSSRIEFSELREADPDVIIVAPCGMEADRIREELVSLTGRDGWRELRASRRARVHPVDGHNYFNRPGPRLLDSLGILVRLLWPGEEHPDETAERLFGGGG